MDVNWTPSLNDIYHRCGKPPEFFHNLYVWGSRVYGTASKTSDWDIVAVVSEESDQSVHLKPNIFQIEKTFQIFDDDVLNVVYIPLFDFRMMLLEHRHEAIQCVFAPPEFKLKETIPLRLELDLSVLRRTVGWESKRRYQRAENTRAARGDYCGRKDVVHSIRYLLFALQLIHNGKLTDFSVANHLNAAMLGADAALSWEDFYSKYGQIRKEISLTLNGFQISVCRSFYELDVSMMSQISKLYRRADFRAIPQPGLGDDFPCLPPVQFVKDNLKAGFVPALDLLKRQLGFDSVFHPTEPNLLFLRRNLFNHPTATSSTPQILIVDVSNWKTIALGCPSAPSGLTPLNTRGCRIKEDIDGTPFILYHYNQAWHVASPWYPTPVTPSAKPQGQGIDCISTPTDLFWKTWNELGCSFPDPSQNQCYELYLVGPFRYIVKHDKNSIVCTRTYNLKTLKPDSGDHFEAKKYNWEVPRSFEFESERDLLEAVEHLNPFKCKGFVIEDVDGPTKYVTNRNYIALSVVSNLSTISPFNLTGDLDKKQVLMLYTMSTTDIFLAYFPEWKSIVNEELEEARTMEKVIQEKRDLVIDVDEKAAQGLIKGNWCQSVIFTMRREGIFSVSEFFRGVGYNGLVKWMKEFQKSKQVVK